MMWRRPAGLASAVAGVCVVVAAASVLPGAVWSQETEQLTAAELEQDIDVLRRLSAAQLQPAELQTLAAVAADVAQKRAALQTALEDPALRASLLQVRDALLAGQTEQQIGPLMEQAAPLHERVWQAEQALRTATEQGVDKLLVELPEAAVESLVAAQAGNPAEHLLGLCHESRHIPPAEYDAWLPQVSMDVAMMLTDGNAQAATTLSAQIKDLLGTTRNLTDQQMEAQQATLAGRVQAIVDAAGQATDPDAAARRARGALSEMLGNPRLHPVLQAKLANG